MASPCSSTSSEEWLELGLGFRSTKKKKKRREEEEEEDDDEEKKLGHATSCPHLEGCDDAYNYEESEGCLNLRLQIGPQNYYNHNNNIKMGMEMGLMHQKKIKKDQRWPLLFHRDSITNNSGFGHSSPPISGLWFSLQSSPNMKGGGALPQIPKAYIRVKDENMTVLMVKKYLVSKLGLSSEAEVELWCMGERLMQTQSLKQVRDGVWLPKLVEFVNSNLPFSSSFSTTTYLMSLHYGRTCFF